MPLITSTFFVLAGSKSGSVEQAKSDKAYHSPPLRLQTSKGMFQPVNCEFIIVFLLKEGAEARVDVLSSPRVTNSTRVHSRHHLLNRLVRESFALLESIMLSLKEEPEARVDVLSSPRVVNSTRVHSRHHLLNRPVREYH